MTACTWGMGHLTLYLTRRKKAVICPNRPRPQFLLIPIRHSAQLMSTSNVGPPDRQYQLAGGVLTVLFVIALAVLVMALKL